MNTTHEWRRRGAPSTLGITLTPGRISIRRAALPILYGILLSACSGGSGDGNGSTGTAGAGGNGSGGTASGGRSGTGGGVPGTGGAAAGGISGAAGVGSGGSRAGTGGNGTGGTTAVTGGTSGSGGNTSAHGGSGGPGGAGGTRAAGGVSGSGGDTSDAGVTGGTNGSGTCGGGVAQSSDVTIDESNPQQKITGFGVSSAWAGSYANASDPDYLWSTTTGAGLSLLRIRYGDGLAIAQSAAKNGATVWMTPWGTGTNGAPGGPDTTTQNNPNGCTGSMPVLSNPTGLASNLVTWVQNAKTQGVPIYAVSAGNEPDSCGINDTTSYSPAEMAAWIDVLGPAMAAIGVKVMAPETENACGFGNFFPAIHNDTAAWNAVSIFASHEYGCGTLPSEPSISAADKEYWETEVDTGTASGDPTGDGIASALLMAQTIHNDLTKANLNAWHLWWLYEGGQSGGCLYDTGSKVWTKRLWVMGNFSRFARPGWKRVASSGSTPSGVLVSAYMNPANNALSIVAINSNTSSKDVSFYVSGSAPCALVPYETSASKNLGQGSAVSVSQSRVTVTLTAQSVTTFVGTP